MMKQAFGFVAKDISQTPLQSRLLGVGRTIIALAQLSFILFIPAKYFLVPVGGIGINERCSDSISSLSAYCLWCSPQQVSFFLSILLVIIASGFAPRWTSLIHFWISYSVAMVISLPDGGESAVTVVTSSISSQVWMTTVSGIGKSRKRNAPFRYLLV
ncbi:hypothetical protein FRC0547_02486 [Corynebacterium diphtheriae]|nr:hypothetical protein FRC0515_00331 [Corynebacterium diphtheriae]CAB1051164.1 hypothetical protein FRC0547_02486 [Corynebacterium diphtheriae]